MKIDIAAEYKDEVEKVIKKLDKVGWHYKYRKAYDRIAYAYHMMMHDPDYQEARKELERPYLEKYKSQYDEIHGAL